MYSLAIVLVLAAYFVAYIWRWDDSVLAFRYRKVTARPRRSQAPAADERFAALEAEHIAKCLEALTPADVEWLKWRGWEAPSAVEKRLRVLEYERQADVSKNITGDPTVWDRNAVVHTDTIWVDRAMTLGFSPGGYRMPAEGRGGAPARLGDRVQIGTAYYHQDRQYDGKTGMVVDISGALPPLLYTIRLHGTGRDVKTMSVIQTSPRLIQS